MAPIEVIRSILFLLLATLVIATTAAIIAWLWHVSLADGILRATTAAVVVELANRWEKEMK